MPVGKSQCRAVFGLVTGLPFSAAFRIEAAENIGETVAAVDPAELVPLAELAGEGFGWGGQFVTSPRDAIRVLADQVADALAVDDLGRQCVTRDTARALIAERDQAERRQREAQQRHEEELAELAEQNRPSGGIPVPEGLEGVDAVTVLMQNELEAEAERKGALQRSTLDEMFTGGLEYHPISDRVES